MTQPKCRNCETEIKERPKRVGDLFWGEKKDGDPLLMVAKPHFPTCSGHPERPKKLPADKEADFLRDRGYSEELIAQALKEAQAPPG